MALSLTTAIGPLSLKNNVHCFSYSLKLIEFVAKRLYPERKGCHMHDASYAYAS